MVKSFLPRSKMWPFEVMLFGSLEIRENVYFMYPNTRRAIKQTSNEASAKKLSRWDAQKLMVNGGGPA